MQDEFASLPAIVPKGPIAIFGLGGGTTAWLMLDLWPSLQLDGWEIDGIILYHLILIDLFSEGKVLPQLQEVNTWLELTDRLMPKGRLTVNCGGINEVSVVTDGVPRPETSSIDGH
ncbi:uncharacterized protein LOC121244773 [Juglans microcarpa x Juglans regia]|uniref:uncharacterized protein LOC121244773 n=1 Tax=Juglans microcarpa x Juglans regia TaxID=2249226 RepID=UPI001B7E809C|nr:uncharacterized protein LOC121244773 [Juglans microcarpa x Juglans regia]